MKKSKDATLLLCKKTQLQLLNFGPWLSTPGAHAGHPTTKLYWTRKYPQLICIGAPFMKKVNAPKFSSLCRPLGSFGSAFLRTCDKFQTFTPTFYWPRYLDSKKTQTSNFKALGGDRFGRNPLFWSPGLTLWALGSNSHAIKLLARSWAPLKSLCLLIVKAKSNGPFSSCGCTNAWASTYTVPSVQLLTFLLYPLHCLLKKITRCQPKPA